jgi:HAD superfamily hydrolase (TIGR01509 family)
MIRRWIFFDVGNVLLDEDPLTYRVFRRHVEAVQRVRPEMTFGELLAARQERAASGSLWPVYEVVCPLLGEVGCAEVWASVEQEVRAEFAALSPLIDGAVALIERLARQYRLGLIANQGPGCRAWLAALGLLEHFSVVALSEERGLFKPDPALFRWATERAGASPAHCVMVGDRLDNDIAPAQAAGMTTVWVRWPRRDAKGWRPDDPDALAYRDALERASALTSQLRPSLTIDTIDELGAALKQLDHRIKDDYS